MTTTQLQVILHKLSRISVKSFDDIILKDYIKRILLDAMEK